MEQEQVIDGGDVADVKHNYATLLYAFDHDDAAGRLWFEAYCERPNDANIRRSYSSYLIDAKRGDLAQKVHNGEELAEMVLQPENKIMPTTFSDAKYILKLFTHLMADSQPQALLE